MVGFVNSVLVSAFVGCYSSIENVFCHQPGVNTISPVYQKWYKCLIRSLSFCFKWPIFTVRSWCNTSSGRKQVTGWILYIWNAWARSLSDFRSFFLNICMYNELSSVEPKSKHKILFVSCIPYTHSLKVILYNILSDLCMKHSFDCILTETLYMRSGVDSPVVASCQCSSFGAFRAFWFAL